MRRFDTVIFDMDGTLLDTLKDLADAVNYALEKMDYPVRTIEEIRTFVGNGVYKLMERAVPENTPPEQVEKSLGIFKAYYREHSKDATRPYPGILPLLESLKRDGVKTGVLSNKYDAAVKELCAEYFPGLIDVPRGEKPGTAKKPAPDGLFAVMRELGAEPAGTLYVGDSEVDARTGKNAGLTFVGVTWGFRSRQVLEENHADFIIDRPEELWNLLGR